MVFSTDGFSFFSSDRHTNVCRVGIGLSLSILASTSFFWASPTKSAIPDTPVMTLYKFNGNLDVPYFNVDEFVLNGDKAKPVGYLAQGSSVIPCLVIRDGRPLTDKNGTPFVGFDVVVNAKKASRDSVGKLEGAWSERSGKMVSNHHCDSGVRHVINVRRLIKRKKTPFYTPRPSGSNSAKSKGGSELDRIVRRFHNSKQCERANERLVGRRGALANAWDNFIAKNANQWPRETLARAKHLDYAMRTAIYEGHLDRGCNAYGACERNVIVLSIRNRARGQCLSRQGCDFPGDFQGASSKVSQYNIWDEYLTQISGLTSCFLRDDLASEDYYAKIGTMYAQSVGDAEDILFGNDQALQKVFPSNSLTDLTSLRHYYHAPAMGKCFPNEPRVEYISGAVATKGRNHALVANTRIRVDEKALGGFYFREFFIDTAPDRDRTSTVDNYPGFVIDDRKVDLRRPSRCAPYGIPRDCRLSNVGRYRKTPFWLDKGKPLGISCNIKARGASCLEPATAEKVVVGGSCDVEMRPVAGVK